MVSRMCNYGQVFVAFPKTKTHTLNLHVRKINIVFLASLHKLWNHICLVYHVGLKLLLAESTRDCPMHDRGKSDI